MKINIDFHLYCIINIYIDNMYLQILQHMMIHLLYTYEFCRVRLEVLDFGALLGGCSPSQIRLCGPREFISMVQRCDTWIHMKLGRFDRRL